jgi:hypothetical protein
MSGEIQLFGVHIRQSDESLYYWHKIRHKRGMGSTPGADGGGFVGSFSLTNGT